MNTVTEVGIEPTDTRLSTSPLNLFAYPVIDLLSTSPLPTCARERREGKIVSSGKAEAVRLELTSLAATCFRDRVLIQPDDFRSFQVQFRELESNQRPPGSEPGVTTNSNYPGMLFDNFLQG